MVCAWMRSFVFRLEVLQSGADQPVQVGMSLEKLQQQRELLLGDVMETSSRSLTRQTHRPQ